MALNANALTTLDNFKAILRIPTLDVTQDTRLELWINAASQLIETLTDRVLINKTHVQVINGRRSERIILQQWPVTTLTEIRIDSNSDFVDANTILDPDEYRLQNDQEIVLLSRKFGVGLHNVQVTYDAGYLTIPSDLELACLHLSEWYENLNDNRNIGRSQKSKNSESVQLLQDVPPIIMTEIMRYKRVQVPLGEIPILNG